MSQYTSEELRVLTSASGEYSKFICKDNKQLYYKTILIDSDVDIDSLEVLHPECLWDGTTYYIGGDKIHKDDLFIDIEWVQ